jgi:hypothetical protein
MRDLNGAVRQTKEPTAVPFDYFWAVGAAATIAGSAMLLWGASAVRSAMRPTRLWYVTPYGAPLGAAAALTAWHKAFAIPSAWWFTPVPGVADRDELTASWGSAFAALGLAVMRAWVTAPDAGQNVVVLWQPAPELEPCSQPVTKNAPYSAYRTDGGHAAAQITVTQLGMDRGDRPCGRSAARSRRSSQVLH